MWTKALFYQIACLLAFRLDPSHHGSYADNSVTINAEHNLHQSYMDTIFGELVHNDETFQYKQQMLALGKLRVGSVETEEIDNSKDFEDLIKHMDGDPRSLYEYMVSNMGTFSRRRQKSSIQKSHDGLVKYRLKLNLPDDDETSDISGTLNLFGGILTYAGFEHFDCFNPELRHKEIDIAVVGAPFDTGVSFRPGARFGPEAIRLTSRRLHGGLVPVRDSHSKYGRIDPYDAKTHNLTIIDCGDVPMTPFDNRVALNQLYRAERSIHKHRSVQKKPSPKIITIGGDHTVTLMALKSAYENYGKVAVLHFDSHIDTWNPKVLGGGITDYMGLNHGTFLHYASEQGYLNEGHCFHLGLRAPYIDADYDRRHDAECGFQTINAREIDGPRGMKGIIERVKRNVGDLPVYITVDIDVLDPAHAPGTGTMEIGGWSGRELLTILDGLQGLNVIGGDVVEVSPPFDTNSEITSLAATAVIDSLLTLMIVNEV